MNSDRLLVLFARAPEAQAREKGLPPAAAADLFGALAQEWTQVARHAGARVAVAAPPEDLFAWRRALAGLSDVVWIPQRGSSFGARLENAARDAENLSRLVVVTGGDVVPSQPALVAAFEALESGATAVLAPAADGGISLVALPLDPDLLRSIGLRRRDVFRQLTVRLASRSRRVAVVEALPDLDGPRRLRALETDESHAFVPLVSLVRRARRIRRPDPLVTPRTLDPARFPSVPRGPPPAA